LVKPIGIVDVDYLRINLFVMDPTRVHLSVLKNLRRQVRVLGYANAVEARMCHFVTELINSYNFDLKE
jgi:hypothetical protein